SLAPWPCDEPVTPAERCVDWNDVETGDAGSLLAPVFQRDGLAFATDASARVGPDAEDRFGLDTVVFFDAKEGGEVWIAFPEPAQQVRLQVARADNAVFASAQRQGQPVALDALQVGPGWLTLNGKSIDWVQLRWDGAPRVYLASICWTAQADVDAAERRQTRTT